MRRAWWRPLQRGAGLGPRASAPVTSLLVTTCAFGTGTGWFSARVMINSECLRPPSSHTPVGRRDQD